MKDALDIVIKLGDAITGGFLKFLGGIAVAMFILSNIKEYSWISKAVVLYLFTH